MKKILQHSRQLLAGVLALAVLLSLTACKTETDNEDGEHSADELARAAVTASGWNPDGVERLGDVLDDTDIAAYAANYYGVEKDAWTDIAVYRAGGAKAFEIAVLKLKDEAGAQAAAVGLEQYIQEREGAFTGYLPDQADVVSQSLTASQGVYAALLICERPEAARDAFFAALNREAPTESLPTQEPSEPTADEMALAILSAVQMDPDTLAYTKDNAALAGLLELAGISPDACGDFAMYWTPGWSVDGRVLYLYVFRMENASALKSRANAITEDVFAANRQAYIETNGGVPFISYEYRLIEEKYAAFVLIDSEVYAPIVHMAFYDLFLGLEWSGRMGVLHFDPPALDGSQTSEDPPSTNPTAGRIPYMSPEKEDMTLYDTSAILAAWESGDPSGLSAYDRAIYDAAAQVLGETLTDGMTDYEKEYALYMWVVTNVEYDYDYQDTLAAADRASYTPYGGLVNRKGICLGFASTFQLLMDMAGVECITVVGATLNSTEDHAWNQVRLDGQWYCVDTTWDYTYYPARGYLYWFNRTSDFYAESSPQHQWDYDSVPEAEGTRYAVS